ncbi:MAG TPA: creatininase family protein [Sedimentibacter sp.]|jgi:creatinine amidohydrolase|nr:creatininase family protein [Sedimentibacter sp.]HOW22405.1 creatininase family protein [Sedimentibacter sp.]
MALFRWDELTWTELTNHRDAIIIIPTGSVEQHGPHLPMGTDTFIAESFAKKLYNKVNDKKIIIAPSITYSYAKLNSNYLGTINLNGNTLINIGSDLISEFLRQGFNKIILINGHLESIPFLMEGIELALSTHENSKKPNSDIPKIVIANWWEFISDEMIDDIFGDKWPGWEAEHAALTETALMKYLYPGLVRDIKVDSCEYEKLPYRILPWDKRVQPSSGSYADPDGATMEIGSRLTEAVISGLTELIEKEF